MKGTQMETKAILPYESIQLKKLLNKTLQIKGSQYPNPAVGAMIIKDNSVIAEGYHEKAGFDHAEVIAINLAGDAAMGSTLLITLEPCTVYGKTPPCVNKIIDAGISRVIWAINDPNPKVFGTAKSILMGHNIQYCKIGKPHHQFNCLSVKQ